MIPIVETNLRFDPVEIAGALGVETRELLDRMCTAVARAIALDALNLANDEMRARGLLLGVDGWPPEWPLLHLTTITQARLWPESAQ